MVPEKNHNSSTDSSPRHVQRQRRRTLFLFPREGVHPTPPLPPPRALGRLPSCFTGQVMLGAVGVASSEVLTGRTWIQSPAPPLLYTVLFQAHQPVVWTALLPDHSQPKLPRQQLSISHDSCGMRILVPLGTETWPRWMFKFTSTLCSASSHPPAKMGLWMQSASLLGGS